MNKQALKDNVEYSPKVHVLKGLVPRMALLGGSGKFSKRSLGHWGHVLERIMGP